MKAYLPQDSDQLIWSEKRIPFAKIVEIGKVLVPWIISVWPWKKDVKLPTKISVSNTIYYLTIEFEDLVVDASYMSDNCDYLITEPGRTEKEARKALHELLIEKGYLR